MEAGVVRGARARPLLERVERAAGRRAVLLGQEAHEAGEVGVAEQARERRVGDAAGRGLGEGADDDAVAEQAREGGFVEVRDVRGEGVDWGRAVQGHVGGDAVAGEGLEAGYVARLARGVGVRLVEEVGWGRTATLIISCRASAGPSASRRSSSMAVRRRERHARSSGERMRNPTRDSGSTTPRSSSSLEWAVTVSAKALRDIVEIIEIWNTCTRALVKSRSGLNKHLSRQGGGSFPTVTDYSHFVIFRKGRPLTSVRRT